MAESQSVSARVTGLTVALCALLGGVPVGSHHSFAAYYSEDQTVSVEGTLAELDYRSPHALVHLLAPDKSGKVQRVVAEWLSPARLSREKIANDTLKPGDRVILIGSPSRDVYEYKMHLKGIVRMADGWRWGAGVQFR